MSIKCQFIVDMYLCFLAYSKEESLSAIRGRSEEDFEVLFNSPLHSNPARRKETSLLLDSLSSWIAAKVSSTVDLFLVPPLSIFQLLFFQGFMINHWCKVLTSLSFSASLSPHGPLVYIKKKNIERIQRKSSRRQKPTWRNNKLPYMVKMPVSIYIYRNKAQKSEMYRPDWRNS